MGGNSDCRQQRPGSTKRLQTMSLPTLAQERKGTNSTFWLKFILAASHGRVREHCLSKNGYEFYFYLLPFFQLPL